jgi:hypothetical protein
MVIATIYFVEFNKSVSNHYLSSIFPLGNSVSVTLLPKALYIKQVIYYLNFMVLITSVGIIFRQVGHGNSVTMTLIQMLYLKPALTYYI